MTTEAGNADELDATRWAIGKEYLVTRWVQLALSVICMMSISSIQYVWTLFVRPFSDTLHVGMPAVQVTFALLIVLQTVAAPIGGNLMDRFGPRGLISTGVVLTGLSWVLAAYVTSLPALYLTYGVIGGIGSGAVIVGTTGQMVTWFPDRRGFAVGMIAAAFGMGAIITTLPISTAIASAGYQAALIKFGIILGLIGLIASLFLKRAPKFSPPIAKNVGGVARADKTSAEMLRTPVFWLMFVMLTMMCTTGLMIISQLATFATDFGLAKATLWGVAVIPLALTIDRLTNGFTRPFFGWVSDRIGRELTMFLAFSLEGIAILVWIMTKEDALLFVVLSGVVFFGWGEIFSLFPATLTDTFGTKHATQNWGFLMCAEGVGSILGGPLAALLHQYSGSWNVVFGVAVAADLATAALAIAVLMPMRRRYLQAQ